MESGYGVGTELPVQIRGAIPSDSAAIVAMAQALTDFENGLDPGAEDAQALLTEVDLEKYCFSDNPVFRVLIAELDAKPVGYTHYCRVFDSEPAEVGLWLGDVFVSSEVRGRGVGRAMLSELVRVGAKLDATWITWQVRRSNSGARRLYDRVADSDDDLTYWTDLPDLHARLEAWGE